VFTVVVLVVLPAFAPEREAASPGALAVAVGAALGKVAVLIAFTMLLGRWLLPRVLAYVAGTRSRELFTLSVLSIALGVAVGSAALFGVSMALGAFLAGMVVGQSEFGARAGADALPMRDAFAVLFFVSVGMLFDPAQLASNLGLLLATIAVIVVGKSLAAYAVIRALRQPPTTAVAVAAALAQIGEFSFILGRKLELLPERATQLLVGASLITITLNPLLFRAATPLARFLGRGRAVEVEPNLEGSDGPHAIVVGHGPVGQIIVGLLKEHDLTPTVIELNHESVRALEQSGIRAIHGDAAQREILEAAGAARAVSLIFTASGAPPEAMIRAARELFPEILIMARSDYLVGAARARAAGAQIVVTAEAEVAFAMSEHLLARLGATGEQIDRARAELRGRLAAAAGASGA
jgi:CPA2 family monovalent cation:H+ antiporter-2